MDDFGRPTWWVSVAQQTRRGPMPITMATPAPKYFRVAHQILSGVGDQSREKWFLGETCFHLQRPATDRELRGADLSRMVGEICAVGDSS